VYFFLQLRADFTVTLLPLSQMGEFQRHSTRLLHPSTYGMCVEVPLIMGSPSNKNSENLESGNRIYDR